MCARGQNQKRRYTPFMQKNGNKGFTLVELIVVIAIIAILAAVSIVGYNQFIDQARDSRASTELDVIVRQVESEYYVDPYEAATYSITFEPSTSTFTITEAGAGIADVSAFTAALVAAINEAMDTATVAVASASAGAASEAEQTVTEGQLYVFGATDFNGLTIDANDSFADVELEYWVAGGKAVWTVDIEFIAGT
jgi:type IV pilus assembly protein PilE